MIRNLHHLQLKINQLDIILLIIGLLLCLIGIVGSFLPIIPGPVTSWLGILLLNLTSAVEFNLNFVLITFTVAVSVGILDYIIPILGVKKLGGSRSGQIGTTVGLIVALIILRVIVMMMSGARPELMNFFNDQIGTCRCIGLLLSQQVLLLGLLIIRSCSVL